MVGKSGFVQAVGEDQLFPKQAGHAHQFTVSIDKRRYNTGGVIPRCTKSNLS